MHKTSSPRLTLAFALFLLVLISRKTLVLIRPEFWGDDGWEWYPDALHSGWACLLQPVNGYLNTLQRLVALACRAMPLLWAARAYAAASLALQAACGVWLYSARMQPAWPDRRARFGFALLAMLLPNEAELYGNLTNAQWLLAVLAALVVCSAAPRDRMQTALDAAILLLSGLSGPFAPLLLPVAGLAWWSRRGEVGLAGATMARANLLLAGAAVQGALLLTAPHHAALPMPLGASLTGLARILVRQVLAGVTFGYANAAKLAGGFWGRGDVSLVLLVPAAVLFVAALRTGPSLLRCFGLFALLVVLAGLLQPHASLEMPQWLALALPPCGNRYFSLLSIAWLGCLPVLARHRRRALAAPGILLLGLTLVFGVPRGWRVPNWHTDFAARAAAFDASPPGTVMTFPLIPPGDRKMRLVRGR